MIPLTIIHNEGKCYLVINRVKHHKDGFSRRRDEVIEDVYELTDKERVKLIRELSK